MSETLQYKGYDGLVLYSAEDKLLVRSPCGDSRYGHLRRDGRRGALKRISATLSTNTSHSARKRQDSRHPVQRHLQRPRRPRPPQARRAPRRGPQNQTQHRRPAGTGRIPQPGQLSKRPKAAESSLSAILSLNKKRDNQHGKERQQGNSVRQRRQRPRIQNASQRPGSGQLLHRHHRALQRQRRRTAGAHRVAQPRRLRQARRDRPRLCKKRLETLRRGPHHHPLLGRQRERQEGLPH